MSRMMSPPIVSDSWLGRGFLRPVLPLHSKEPVLEQPERERERLGKKEEGKRKTTYPWSSPFFSPLPFPLPGQKKVLAAEKKVSDNNQK